MGQWTKDSNNNYARASEYIKTCCAIHGCRFALRGAVKEATGEYNYCDAQDQRKLLLAFDNEGGCKLGEVGGKRGVMTRHGFTETGAVNNYEK